MKRVYSTLNGHKPSPELSLWTRLEWSQEHGVTSVPIKPWYRQHAMLQNARLQAELSNRHAPKAQG